MKAVAYFIDPKGNTIEVTERHITDIIAHPEKFGMTRKWIDSIHKKHHEKIGSEGNAREQIIFHLMKSGWIRLRYISTGDSWHVQLAPEFALDYKDALTKWAKKIVREDERQKYAAVQVLDAGGNVIEPVFQVYEIATGALYEKRKKGTFAEFLNPSPKRKIRRRKRS